MPLTSRCNTFTLPETRGPNFLLPSEVVSALMHVRYMEQQEQHDDNEWFHLKDKAEEKQRLPPSPFAKVSKLLIDEKVQDERHPSVAVLMEEVKERVKRQEDNFEAIVIAGEGEPTLRLSALLSLARSISQKFDTPIRVTTNGLASVDCVKEMKDVGVDAVSVALMTADTDQYNKLMEPIMDDKHKSAHEMVCEFVREAVEVGLEVEVTGVDHGLVVDKSQAERLAASLGVTSPFRWRPYFT